MQLCSVHIRYIGGRELHSGSSLCTFRERERGREGERERGREGESVSEHEMNRTSQGPRQTCYITQTTYTQ